MVDDVFGQCLEGHSVSKVIQEEVLQVVLGHSEELSDYLSAEMRIA
jgi:hypothetical protein